MQISEEVNAVYLPELTYANINHFNKACKASKYVIKIKYGKLSIKWCGGIAIRNRKISYQFIIIVNNKWSNQLIFQIETNAKTLT